MSPESSAFDDFYAAFSERFRGPYAVIKERLRVHARTVREAGEPLGRLLDLGVGRGEWMELAAEAGWQCTGIDTNPTIVAGTRARGFDVIQVDALEYIRGLGAASIGVVTAFHIIEHLPPEAQLQLFLDAFRILKPGGLLLVEWPNAEHPRVAEYDFWVDPTHRTLLPHELVSFMAEHVGFADLKLLRLDNGKIVHKPARDIALVAHKPRTSG